MILPEVKNNSDRIQVQNQLRIQNRELILQFCRMKGDTPDIHLNNLIKNSNHQKTQNLKKVLKAKKTFENVATNTDSSSDDGYRSASVQQQQKEDSPDETTEPKVVSFDKKKPESLSIVRPQSPYHKICKPEEPNRDFVAKPMPPKLRKPVEIRHTLRSKSSSPKRINSAPTKPPLQIKGILKKPNKSNEADQSVGILRIPKSEPQSYICQVPGCQECQKLRYQPCCSNGTCSNVPNQRPQQPTGPLEQFQSSQQNFDSSDTDDHRWRSNVFEVRNKSGAEVAATGRQPIEIQSRSRKSTTQSKTSIKSVQKNYRSQNTTEKIPQSNAAKSRSQSVPRLSLGLASRPPIVDRDPKTYTVQFEEKPDLKIEANSSKSKKANPMESQRSWQSNKESPGIICKQCHCDSCYKYFRIQKPDLKQDAAKQRVNLLHPTQVQSHFGSDKQQSSDQTVKVPWTDEWFKDLVQFRKQQYWDCHAETIKM